MSVKSVNIANSVTPVGFAIIADIVSPVDPANIVNLVVQGLRFLPSQPL